MDWLRRLAMGFSLAAIAAACVSAWSAHDEAPAHVAAASAATLAMAPCEQAPR